MPLYFLHVGDGRTLFKDEQGRLCTPEEAKAYAAELAVELGADGAHYHGFAVNVIDESGREIVRIPISIMPRS
jgi:hypothetical protein